MTVGEKVIKRYLEKTTSESIDQELLKNLINLETAKSKAEVMGFYSMSNPMDLKALEFSEKLDLFAENLEKELDLK